MSLTSKEDCLTALKDIEQLYPTPAVWAKVSHLLKNPDVNLEDIVRIIRTDPSLTSDIIRVSNSVFYGANVASSNLLESLSRIGFKEVLRIIGLSISKSTMHNNLEAYGISAESYWSTSFFTALSMEAIAEKNGHNMNDAYTVGILHSIGRLIIDKILEDFQASVYWNQQEAVEEWEHDLVGYNYAYAGAVILHRWNFPEELCDIIRFQLSPRKMEDPPVLVKILNYLVTTYRENPLYDIGNISEWEIPDNDILDDIDLEVDEVREILESCAAKLKSTRDSLSID